MNSRRRGIYGTRIGVAEDREDGFWIVLPDQCAFIDYEQFPWFREMTRAQRETGVMWSEDWLRWDEFDLDIGVDSIHHPEKYPLRFPPFIEIRR